jgi:hypothetical protein
VSNIRFNAEKFNPRKIETNIGKIKQMPNESNVHAGKRGNRHL